MYQHGGQGCNQYCFQDGTHQSSTRAYVI